MHRLDFERLRDGRPARRRICRRETAHSRAGSSPSANCGCARQCRSVKQRLVIVEAQLRRSRFFKPFLRFRIGEAAPELPDFLFDFARVGFVLGAISSANSSARRSSGGLARCRPSAAASASARARLRPSVLQRPQSSEPMPSGIGIDRACRRAQLGKTSKTTLDAATVLDFIRARANQAADAIRT